MLEDLKSFIRKLNDWSSLTTALSLGQPPGHSYDMQENNALSVALSA